MLQTLMSDIESAIGLAPSSVVPLSGGCVGEVYRALLPDGRSVVAKVGRAPDARLGIEGYMLRYLACISRLPVPKVLHSSDHLLLIEFIEDDGLLSPQAQAHAADLLADLHSIRADAYGLERDTLIGGLHQPNPWTASWLDFFRDQRLIYMAAEAFKAGRLPQHMLGRVEKLADRLDRWLEEPEHPSLLHGDVWGGNVLTRGGRISAFIDPAIYYGHAEIELAFTTLFSTFGAPFFERYQALRPISPGFFEERRDLYNLYPLLVHVRLFGGGYVQSVDRTLRRFGF